MSSNKLSQSEIDNLIASLLTGEATEKQPDAAKDQGAGPTAEGLSQAAPDQLDPAAMPAASTDAPTREVPFDALLDLGIITQAEVDQARETHQSLKEAAPAPLVDDPSGILAQALATVAQPEASAAPSPEGSMPTDTHLAGGGTVPQPAAAAAPAPTAGAKPASPSGGVRSIQFPDSLAAVRGALLDIELTVTVELGRARLSLGDVLELGPGSVISLEKVANTPVDVKVNGLSIMKAEVLAIGEKYGVRITQSNMKVRTAS